MGDLALAALFAVFVWWSSTAILLYLDHLPRRTHIISFSALSVLTIAACYGLYISSFSETVWSAYMGFTCAIIVWGWHELSFLMGLITGPRKTTCPKGATGWNRFGYATAVVIYHELALALTAGIFIALTWNAPNPAGMGTFMTLWIMRLSAKLNVYLGVSNIAVDFVPAHLAYMLSYFGPSRLNPLMPISLFCGIAGVIFMSAETFSVSGTAFAAAAWAMVTTTLALAVVEHAFLVLPVPDAALWRWAQRLGNGT